MKEEFKIKTELHLHLLSILKKREFEISNAIVSAVESRDNDTKSSAGDKHETSRAQAQIEIDKLEVQLNKTLVLEKELSSIPIEKEFKQVEMGSLVFTNQENYFISIGLGKLELQGNIYYAISLASPVGKFLQGKKAGEKVYFLNREITIHKIL